MTQTLTFDPKTISVLKNFAHINPSIYFREGSTVATISPSKTVMAYATVKEEFDSAFAIYDLAKFLSILSIFDTPEIAILDNYCTITEGTRSVNYTFCDPSNIRVPPASEKNDFGEPLVSFNLTDKQLVGILKGTSILRSPEIAIIGDGKNVSIQGINSENPSDNTYSVIVDETDKKFRIILTVENLKLLTDTYNVCLYKTSKGAILVKFVSDSIIYYNIAETNSIL